MTDTYELSLTDKQYAFVEDRESWEILYSGAFGAGKTRALCVRAMMMAQHPRAKVGMCRKTLKAFRDTTLRTLIEPDGDLPPVIPEGTYSHNKNDCRIRFHHGGIIDYFGCEDADRLGSLFFSDICIDEAIEFSEKEYAMLEGRLRVSFMRDPDDADSLVGSGRRDGVRNINTLAMATNPGDPSHFLYQRFFVDDHEHRRVIHTESSENTYLSSQYIERLAGLQGVSRERYFKGQWVSFEGSLVVPGLRDCVIDAVPWDYRTLPDNEMVGGIDYGYTDPTAIITGVYRDQVLYIIDVYRASRLLSCDHAQNVMPGHTYYGDPAGTQAREDLASEVRRLHGRSRIINAPRAKKSALGSIVESEWGEVRRLIAEGRLKIVESAAKQLLIEADNLCYSDTTGKVNQYRNDTYGHFDCLDALRYMAMGCVSMNREPVVAHARRETRREAMRDL